MREAHIQIKGKLEPEDDNYQQRIASCSTYRTVLNQQVWKSKGSVHMTPQITKLLSSYSVAVAGKQNIWFYCIFSIDTLTDILVRELKLVYTCSYRKKKGFPVHLKSHNIIWGTTVIF